MSDSICLVSDIHGCWGTLVRLLNQVAVSHPGARLMLGGDLIDRGPHSRQVVEFAMAHSIPTVCGNHEDLALDYSQHARRGFTSHCGREYERDIWATANGGDVCLASFERGGTQVVREESIQGGIVIPERVHVGPETRLPDEVLKWMQALPAYLEPDAPLDENGLKLLVSHNGHGLAADKGNWWQALWARHVEFPDDGRWRTVGHTPVKTPQLTPTYGAIDTGAAYADRGGGIMTALIWPTKTLVQQAFDESPVEPTFAMVDGCVVPR